MRKPRDLGILLGHALVGIDQDQAHVGTLDGRDGAHVAVALDGVIDLRLAAHTGRVDKEVLAPVVFKIAVDRVARRTRHVGDDHALLTEDAVEEAGLADVRLSDDGDLDDILVIFLAVILRKRLHAGVEQISRAVAVDGGDLDGIAEAEAVELIDLGVHAAGAVALVGSQHDRLSGALEHRRDLRVGGGEADRHIDHHDDHVCRLDGDLRLTAHEFQHVIVGARLDAAGIDQHEIASAPFAVAVDAVAGHAGRILDDRHAAAGEFVKEHRFADIRTANDGYNGLCHNGLPSFVTDQNASGALRRSRKEEGADTLLSFSYSYGVKSLCRLDSDHFTAVVIAASLTSSVRQAGLAALRASNNTGDRQFPVGAASLVSSRAGNFSLGYCHLGTPP